MPKFHETRMGQIFFEGTTKRISKSLESISESLIQSNKLKEKELALKEEEIKLKLNTK